MPAANSPGLFNKGYLGKAATMEFSGGSQPGDTCADNANFVVRVGCLGDAAFLFDQRSIVEAEVGGIWKASRPFVFNRALCSSESLGGVGGVVVA